MSTVSAATFAPPRPSAHPVDVGLRTEAAITRRLIELGYSVSIPVGSNQRYDLIVDVGELLRVQCKTGRLRCGAVEFNTISVRSNTRGARSRNYIGEIDYFLVFYPDTDRVYFMSIEEATSSKGTLRIAPTANNQARGIRWAADHELPSAGPALAPYLHSARTPE
jgi:hypothetical protein